MDFEIVVRELGESALQAAERAGPVIASAGGHFVLSKIFDRTWEALGEAFERRKRDGRIDEEFEQSHHGQTLLQEALNAMAQGLDEERAKAVQKVFLGLAMNPVEDSLARMMQIDVMRAASTLNQWEALLFNAIERYSAKYFDPNVEHAVEHSSASEKGGVIAAATKDIMGFEGWLRSKTCGGDATCVFHLRKAWESLHEKRVLSCMVTNMTEKMKGCVYRRQGPFTDYGWQLASYLYEATPED